MKKREKISPEVNLTPLIDIVFLLLVFFMLTAHFVKEESINLELPESESAESFDEKIIEITLLKTGEFYFEEKKISKESLQKRLTELLGQGRNKDVFIRGDKEVPLKLLVKTMDICKLSGAKSVSIETKK